MSNTPASTSDLERLAEARARVAALAAALDLDDLVELERVAFDLARGRAVNGNGKGATR